MTTIIPPKTSTANKKRDWINCIVQVHDLVCSCEKPLEHTTDEILHQEPTIRGHLKKCHGFTDTQDGGDDGLGDVDLAAFFEGDFGEKDGAGTATG